jgi:predicted DNA binding protein
MSVIAEFTIDADEFLLGEILDRDPVAHIEMERIVPTSRRLMPYVWVHGGEFDQFEAAIRASDHVKDITELDRVDGSGLYRIKWEDEAESLISGMAESKATILEARGKDEWFFRIRFETHAGLTEFHNFCREHDIGVELERVYTLTDEDTTYRFELTDAQRRTLYQAVKDGYFEVPRRTTLSEVGDKLGITEQSVSENLRRGADRVLKEVLFNPSASEFVGE